METRPQENEPSRETEHKPFSLQTAHDLVALLEEQIEAVRRDLDIEPLEKARVIAYVAGLALKVMEGATVAARMEDLEAILKRRKTT